MSDFIRIGSRLINQQHIISVEYSAPHAGGEDDGEGGTTHAYKAEVKIITSELHSKRDEAYEGEYLATVAVSRSITVKGAEAEALWNFLSDDALYPMANDIDIPTANKPIKETV